MSDGLWIFGVAWVLCQTASLLMLSVGSRFAGHRHLLRIGEVAHRRKMRALETVWPLTRVRPAVSRGDSWTCTVILSSLIILKSAASLVFGVVMVFWLPLASLVVPAIVAVHDPGDPGLSRWIRKVSVLQVTSHGLAAALGYAIALVGPLRGASIAGAIESESVLFVVVCIASLLFAVAAGRAEAAGIMKRGI